MSTYYNYKKKNYPIISFLQSLTKEELLELEKTGQIKKYSFASNILSEMLLEYDMFFKEITLIDSFYIEEKKIDKIELMKKTFSYNYFKFIREYASQISIDEFKIKFAIYMSQNVDFETYKCWNNNYDKIFNLTNSLVQTISFLAESNFEPYNSKNSRSLDIILCLEHNLKYSYFTLLEKIENEEVFREWYSKLIEQIIYVRTTVKAELYSKVLGKDYLEQLHKES